MPDLRYLVIIFHRIALLNRPPLHWQKRI